MKTITTVIVLLGALAVSSPAAADAIDDLEALSEATSDGGATITDAEASAYVSSLGFVFANRAVLGIVVANRLRGEAAFATSEGYARIINAFRYRVVGLATSQIQAPGVSFRRWHPSLPLLVVLDRLGVSYTAVDVIYTWDGWATTRAVSLGPRVGDYYAAAIPDAPLSGRLEYAVHLFGDDGRDFWLNNGRDLGIYGGTYFLDYSIDLGSALVYPTTPARPAFSQLVHSFTHPASAGGEIVTSAELSLLVEQITWEGGPGVEDRRALRPALDAIYDLELAGTSEAGTLSNMRGFIDAQILPTATFPGIFFGRDALGALTASMGERPAISATIIYSTDGWDIPHVAECARSAPDEALTCHLGHIPPGAHIAYTIALHYDGGDVRWIRASRGNFFHALPTPAPN